MKAYIPYLEIKFLDISTHITLRMEIYAKINNPFPGYIASSLFCPLNLEVTYVAVQWL